MPLLSALRLLALLLLLGVTGYQLARRALGMRCPLAVSGMTVFAGMALLMMTANAWGHVFPVRTAAIAAVMTITLLCVACLRCPSPGAWDPVPRRLFWLVATLGILGGWATARFLTSDMWTWGQLPVTATVIAGNMPIVEPVNPGHALGYHYGPQFLAAIFTLLTDVSVATSYNLQPFAGLLGALFLTAAVARRISRSSLAVALATLLFLGASGIQWLRGTDLLFDLLSGSTGNPFRHIAPMFANTFGPSLLLVFGSRTYTLGIPSFMGALLLLDATWRPAHRFGALWGGALAVVFCLSLALTAETALVLLGASAAVTVALRWHWNDNGAPPSIRVMATAVLGVLGLAALLAGIQGGVLTEALRETQVSPDSFEWSNGLLPAAFPGGPYYGPWHWPFLRSVGLPFALLPVAIWLAWKRRQNPLVVVLAGLMVSHAVIPFVIRYGPRHNEMLRLLYIALSTSAFFLGIGIGESWPRLRTGLRWVACLVVAAMLASSAIYLPVRLIAPTMRLETAPLFASLPAGTPAQHAMYDWVRAHTSLSDWFYTRTLPGDPFAVDPTNRVEERSEEENQIRERILFMTHTGRYNIGFLHWGNFTPEQRSHEERFEASCSPEALAAIGARFLVIETAEREAWFASSCTAKDWLLRYPEDPVALPRIYERSGGDTAPPNGIH